MPALASIVFGLVYLGMLLGRFPRLGLDRTGIALLGAIALLAGGALDLEQALAAVDLPTLALLFGLMVVSAQLRLGGFYAACARRIGGGATSPARLLAGIVGLSGALAAVFSNDVVCLAVAPVVIELCRQRRLDPVPFLLALACAANVGSAATLIGNPQNMLIGQALGTSFAAYLADAAVPAALGLLVVWLLIWRAARRDWAAPRGAVPREAAAAATAPAAAPLFDRWQCAKGLGVAAAAFLAFLFAPWPREIVALAAAGLLLTSRRLHSREMLGLVDWQLLVLFAGLFVVNAAFQDTGLTARAVDALGAAGFPLERPPALFAGVAVLGNAVSNVPAVMLLLPHAVHPQSAAVLGLASTLAGNLLLVGSIANLIVADAAAAHGIRIDWRRHARTGVPVTLVTLAIAAGWLVVVGG